MPNFGMESLPGICRVAARTLRVGMVAAALTLSSGCVSMVNKGAEFPGIYEQRPVSILVLPPINKTTAADAKEYYSTTILEPLALQGYYVMPIGIINDIMKQEGLYDSDDVYDVAPQTFKKYFDADAVMTIRINQWESVYFVLGGYVAVGVDATLKSTTNGAQLWHYAGVIQVDTSGGNVSGAGLAGLLAKAIIAAAQTAMTDYVPIARVANFQMLSSMPFGKYHPQFGTDKDMEIVQKPQAHETQDDTSAPAP
ncbi:MAG: DUF799 domain-containing protein [Magnetococcus sp. WYHC-3]